MNKYKCFFRHLIVNKVTSKKEVVEKSDIIVAKSKSQAKKFCEYENGVKPFKVKVIKNDN